MWNSTRLILVIPLVLSLLSVPPSGLLRGAEPFPAAKPVDFQKDIQPILETRCHACHGAQVQMNGLRLDRREEAIKGSHQGPVIVPGESDESLLIRMVSGEVPGRIMPPQGTPLSQQELDLLRSWIDQGATWADTEAPPTDVSDQVQDRHWSFRPLTRPPVPEVENDAWVQNPIDAFVLHRLEDERIPPSPEANRLQLIRRAQLDVTGLPASPQETADFVHDDSPRAYERLIERLLGSKHYGERWARHWLDQARYADSDGYEKDDPRPYAWRYRHWVINALNRDLPFDQFTIEQLAGDLLPGATIEQKTATGFHRNTLKNREGGVNVDQYRFEEVVDRTATVGKVWLGLTLGCAQCHDHKYDPISQADFYRFFAFFNSADEVNIDAPLEGEMEPYRLALPEFERKKQALLQEYRVAELQKPWEKELLRAGANPGQRPQWDLTWDILRIYVGEGEDGQRIIKMSAEDRTPEEAYLLTRFFVKQYGRVLSKEESEKTGFKELGEKLDALEAELPPLARAQTLVHRKTRPTHIHLRGQWDRTGLELKPGTPRFLPALDLPPEPNRLDLGRWVAHPRNPLTARVAVNRIWQEYFGRGLVASSDNFGTQGEMPSHPQLLDWLASELIRGDWSLKKVHKLILTSATYRQSSAERPELAERDPNNSLLARQVRLRLPAESIRDSVLAVSGLLNPEVGGRSVRPPLPESVAKLGYSGGIKWEESKGADQYRRSLYIHYQRTVPYPFLANFDMPDANQAACSRERSNTPLQALNLLNDPLFFQASQALATRILEESPGADFGKRLSYAFRLCLGREPEGAEKERLSDYFEKQGQLLEKDPQVREALSAHQEDGTLELAGWVGLSRVLLNLDEFITRE